MKNVNVFMAAMSLTLVLALAGCGKTSPEAWDCTVFCAEPSASDSYGITYSDQEIVSDSGIITFQNRNKFDITVYLCGEGSTESAFSIPAGGVAAFKTAKKNVEYRIGVHAEVAAGSEIKVTVYDGETSEVYALE